MSSVDEQVLRPEPADKSRLVSSCTEETSTPLANTVHERLYNEALANRRRKEKLNEIDAQAELMAARKNNPRRGHADDKLYLDAKAKRELLQSLERKADDELRNLREAPKFGPRSRAVYRNKIARELRAAVDACQPDRPGSLTLHASLVGCVLQYLGIFHEDHMGEFCSAGKKEAEVDAAAKEVSDNQMRTNEKAGLFKIVRDLQARTRLATEKILADKLVEKLDVEGEGEIFVDRLFSFLAVVTTEYSDLRPRWAGDPAAQKLGDFDFDCLHKTAKELHSLGLASTYGNSAPSSPLSRKDLEKMGAKQLEVS
ncbi:hypothetical protein TGCAST_233150 [Toxoplasma gondii CAST]|uniref:Uncharacterized protein n=1 Tax=Toxoplasma gondii CAST TaxID=943122 RepID=A0A425I9R3_TOXGO|nr:hypothetical protein TGCAST_233150 [Toxoplasma gondii CAST]